MKLLDIAFKDLLHFFHSAFALAMMFIAPLIIPTLIYLAFGNMNNGGGTGGGFDLPQVRVIVANLDQPDSQSNWSASQLLVEYLQSQEAAGLVAVTTAANEIEARNAVHQRNADVAAIIPAGFTSAALNPGKIAEIQLVNEPTLKIGPEVVKTLISGFIEGLSGAKIAVGVSQQQLNERGVEMSEEAGLAIAEKYIEWVQATSHSDSRSPVAPLIQLESPSGSLTEAMSSSGMIGPIVTAMIIFFLFFTGANGASMLIQEEEDGTLARLFTTPTPLVTILGGKFLSVLVTLALQSLVLLAVARWLFNIQWGAPLTLGLAMLALIIAASGFGLFLMSFIHTTRQAGAVLGGVLTIMGMLGGLFTAFIADMPAAFNTISLITPQGWALRSLKLALAGATFKEALLPIATLLGMGLVFYLASVFIFRKRFA
jgi:ABC-2 type transport system permease protein